MKTDALPFGLNFIQTLEALAMIVGCIVVILLVSAFVLDKLDVKSFNFKTGFTFYEDGSTRKSRLTGRRKTVNRRVKK